MQRKQFLGRLYCRRRGGADVDFKAFNGRVSGFVEIEKPAVRHSHTHTRKFIVCTKCLGLRDLPPSRAKEAKL